MKNQIKPIRTTEISNWQVKPIGDSYAVYEKEGLNIYHLVATVNNKDPYNDEETNAKLIAAAPDFFKACKAIAEGVGPESIKLCKQAVAKVEGN